MRPDPIDFDSPLGISKREWVKVLGANLALLLIVYTVALVCTLCGSKLFLLNFHNDDLQRIEETLRSWNIFALTTIAFATIETCIMASYVCRRIVKWYFAIALFVTKIVINITFTACNVTIPSFVPTLINAVFLIGISIFEFSKDKWYKVTLRLLIAVAVSLILNIGISLFREKWTTFFLTRIPLATHFALTIEYQLALALTLGFLTLAIYWEKGVTKCKTNPAAGGSSPSMMKCSPKPSKIATNNLPPKYRKRLRLLKVKVMAIQTIGLIVIAALPWFTGRPVEFALVYASFCITRLMLGFNRSLHFKSEMVCVTSGALVFWGLTFLTPNVETSIILSLVYGAGLALGFRLYWELHDLMMYKKASKTDRYAMFYTAFKGNIDPKHINGVMRAKDYTDKDEIKMVQMYMAKEKVEYIAEYLTFAKITIEKKLTGIANDLYSRR